MRTLTVLALFAVPLTAADPPPAADRLPADAAFAARLDVASLLKRNPLGPLVPGPEALAEFNETLGVPLESVESVLIFVAPAKEGPRGRPPFEMVRVVTTLKPFGKPNLPPYSGGVAVFDGDTGRPVKEPAPPKVGAGEVAYGFGEVFVPISERQFVLCSLEGRARFGKDAPAAKTSWIREAIARPGDATLAATDPLAALGVRPDRMPEALMPLGPLLRMTEVSAALDLSDGASLRLSGTAARGEAADAEKAAKGVQLLASVAMFEAARQTLLETKDDFSLLFKPLRQALDAAVIKFDGSRGAATISLDAAQVAAMAKGLPPLVERTRRQAAAVQNANNMKQLGLAMLNYEAANQTYPSFAPMVGKAGKPLLSWRVAMLPYIEQGQLYAQFKLDEPWDSDHNKKLIPKMPKLFVTPGEANRGKTHYRVFAGNGAAFEADPAMPLKLLSITDGTSNTLLVVEAAEAAEWTKPEAIEYDPKEKDPAKWLRDGPGGCLVGIADGSVRRLKKGIAAQTLHALITRAGGEVIASDD